MRALVRPTQTWAFVAALLSLASPAAAIEQRDWGGFEAGYSLELRNTGDRDLRVGDLRVAPGRSETITAGVGAFELGGGLTYLLFGEGHQAGFTLLSEAGFHGSAFAIPWNDDSGDEVDGLGELALRGVFIRVKVGGGGWFDFGS